MRPFTSRNRALLFAVSCAATACVTSAGSVRPNAAIHASRVVGAEELEPLAGMAADDALGRIRPEWPRDEYRNDAVELRIDGRPASIADLHALRAGVIQTIQMLTPVEAALEYGSLHKYPILDIRLRRP